MKKTRRLLCLLLTLVLALSLCVIPAAAADDQTRSDDPVVFVHGLFGWGQRDKIFRIMPYWGMTTGSLPDYLATQGYETYAASVGPLSSAWDRACELYAQLVGARTDYGVKHAQDFGHERYGIDYETPLFEGWGTQRAVNLVGHSFGGATTRLFLEILTNGCPEEVAAAKAAGVEPSPFFLGGKGSWVHSLTAIAAPHNGTTFIEANSDFTKFAADLATGAAKALGLSSLKGVYDFQLDQFGIRKDDNETFSQALDRVLRSDFLSHNDNAFLDLTIDKSLEINKGIEIQPNVYYFSYAGDQTSTDPLTGNHYPTVSAIPSNGMCALMMPGSVNMGKYYDKYTAGGIYIDQSWLPNDGLVNTVSALYPTTTDKNTTECLKRDGTQGWVNYDGYSDIAFQPGIWYVMPVTRADHMQFVGGIANKSIIETHLFYRNLMDDIYSTYHTVQPTETPFPFTDVPESRWSYPYIKELYDAGVVSGTSATTFEPTANVTRAQFVTMLAGLQGADVSAYTSGKFSDVPADAWYAPYVNWAAENGVVYGVSDTAFAPDAEISRQDMAAMLYRYAGQFGIQLGTGNPAITFTDEADIADYALPAVEALQRAGVISGMPDGSFRPRDTATREQACVMLCLL